MSQRPIHQDQEGTEVRLQGINVRHIVGPRRGGAVLEPKHLDGGSQDQEGHLRRCKAMDRRQVPRWRERAKADHSQARACDIPRDAARLLEGSAAQLVCRMRHQCDGVCRAADDRKYHCAKTM